MSVLNSTTSTTKPSNPSDGELFFETDTRKLLLWDGQAWREYDNTSGASSGSGSGESGSGTGESGSGSGESGSNYNGSGESGGESGSGSGSESGSGDGGTTPGAGTGIVTGISNAVAQPGSNHGDTEKLGDDTSTGDVYALRINDTNGVPMIKHSTGLAQGNPGGYISLHPYTFFNSQIQSFWFKWEADINESANKKYILVGQSRSQASPHADKSWILIETNDVNGRQSLKFHMTGVELDNMILHQGHSNNTDSSQVDFFPVDDISAVTDGSNSYTYGTYPPYDGPNKFQISPTPFQHGRWYNLVLHHWRNDKNDHETSNDQWMDVWLDGVKQSTHRIKFDTAYLPGSNFDTSDTHDNIIIGDNWSEGAESAEHINNERFPGLIQRFTYVKFVSNSGTERIPDTAIEALYALGAEDKNLDFYTLPVGTSMTIYDTLFGDQNVFPGSGNSIPMTKWIRISGSVDGTNPASNLIGTSDTNWTPTYSNQNFAYEAKTYDKPYAIGFGTWNGQEYSDGILKSNYKPTYNDGGSVSLWFNINDVDKPGIHYLVGARNNPQAEGGIGNNPDQLAIAVENDNAYSGTRFRVYYMQEDATFQAPEVQSGEWHHLVFSFDTVGAYARFWINGQLKGSLNGISSAFSGNQLPPFYIGDANGGNNPFEGLLANVMFFQRRTPQGTINEIYNRGPSLSRAELAWPSNMVGPVRQYLLDGRLNDPWMTGYSAQQAILEYTGTGKPKYARNRAY
tara:strand:+ start:2005 stop:4224 length:2220 start_codon:yes stop_codon:yes gene_type:complete